MEQQFSSKRDLWLTAVIVASAAAVVGASITLALQDRWPLALVLVFFAAGMLWVFYGTRYTLTESDLIISCGPFRWRIDRASITDVVPTNDPIASPASSLDRLEIRYGAGKRILVSPADKQRFCAALNPKS